MVGRRCPNGGNFGCPEGTPCKFAPVCEKVGFWVPSIMTQKGEFRLTVNADVPEYFKERLVRYGFEVVSEREFVLYPATEEEQKAFDGNCPHQE